MTGIELIAKERQEQIEKHGFSPKHDMDIYHLNGELRLAAEYLISSNENPYYPDNWDEKYKNKFDSKTYIERLATAGALLAAEIDRIVTLTNELRVIEL
jgi:hypothetical protein